MKLNHNSISAKLYRWFYMTDKMPQTLCPYFWKLVIVYLLAIPWAIITLPTRIIRVESNARGEKFVISILLWAMILSAICVLSSISLFWGICGEQTLLGTMQRIGIFTLCLVTLVAITGGIIFLITYIQDKKREKQRNQQKEYIWNENNEYVPNPNYVPYAKKQNIFIEFIKAKYNKYCPKIDWTR